MTATVTNIRDFDNWRARLVKKQTRRGDSEIVGCKANAVTYLRCDPAWRDVLAFNDLSRGIVCLKAPPWYGDPMCVDDRDGEFDPTRPWEESDGCRVEMWLQRRSPFSVSEVTAYKAALLVALGRRFDPLRDYLEGLVWDKQPRIHRWLHTYFGAEDTPYSRLVGRIFLNGSVRRALYPGCKFDTMLILEGEQDKGKSEGARRLFGDEYFRETPLDLHSNDRFLALRGCWCREWPELDGLGKADVNRVKNFVSARVDDFRAPYARSMMSEKRRCVLIGTVNPPQLGYLTDESGNRRMLPVVCGVTGPIVHEAISADRDQIWAEAMVALKAGQDCYTKDAEEKKLLRGEQSARMVSEVWATKIETWLKVNRSGAGSEVTIPEILSGPLGIPTERQDRSAQIRVGNALGRIGWHVVRRDSAGARERYYGRKDEAPAPSPDDEERAAIGQAAD